MKSNNTKSLVEGALLAAINIILSIMAIYMQSWEHLQP